MPFFRFGVKSAYSGRRILALNGFAYIVKLDKMPKLPSREYLYAGHVLSSNVPCLWDIVLTQPKLAVGRIVLHNHLKDFPEPSFLKLKEVNAKMNEYREAHGRIVAERWHRGNYCGLEDVTPIARFANFTLVPKTEEEKLWKELETCKKPDVVVLPSTVAFPPVFKDPLRMETASQIRSDSEGVETDESKVGTEDRRSEGSIPKMFMEQRHNMIVDRYPLHLDANLPDNFYVRVAEDGEEPTVPNEEVDGLGTTSQPHLYEGVPLELATIPPPKNSVRVPTIDLDRREERPIKILEEPIEMDYGK